MRRDILSSHDAFGIEASLGYSFGGRTINPDASVVGGAAPPPRVIPGLGSGYRAWRRPGVIEPTLTME